MTDPGRPDPEQILERTREALDRAGVDAWEIYFLAEDTFSVEVKEQAVEALQAARHCGLAVRVIARGRMGFAFGSDLGEAAAADLAARATASAAEVSPDENFSFTGPDPDPLPELPLYDPERRSRRPDEKIERAMALEAAAMAEDRRVKRVRKAEYTETEEEVFLWTSHGLRRRCRSTLFRGSLGAMAEGEGDAQIAYEVDFSRFYARLDLAAIGRRAAAKAVSLLGAKPAASRSCPMVLTPETAAELLQVLAAAVSAEAVAKGKSWLADSLGRPILSPVMTVVDDGLHPAAPGSFPFDGEGERSRRTTVFEAGTLNSFLFDRYHARKLGGRSTGNSARAGYAAPPAVGESCFYLEPGRDSAAALISRMGRGVVVEELLGVHLADEVTGDFSLGCVGHLVEGGKIGAPFSGMALAGQLGDLFRAAEAVGNDLRFFGEVGSPSLLVGKVSLSGR